MTALGTTVIALALSLAVAQNPCDRVKEPSACESHLLTKYEDLDLKLHICEVSNDVGLRRYEVAMAMVAVQDAEKHLWEKPGFWVLISGLALGAGLGVGLLIR